MRGNKNKAWIGPLALILALSLGLSVLLVGCGSNPSTASMSPQDQLAAQRGYILIGVVAPMTGPLASLGEGMDWATSRAVDAINKDGGISINSTGKKLPVKLKVMDSESDPTTAAQVATDLVTKDKADMLLAYMTPAVCNPVDSVGERYHVPTISLGEPNDSFAAASSHEWSFNAFWSSETTVNISIGELKQYASQTDKVVGIVAPNDTDGIVRSQLYNQMLPQNGFKVVDPGRFPESTNDFTSLISQFKSAHVDSIVAVVQPPTFDTLWRQMHEQGFVPKFAYVGLALLLPSNADALGGNLAEGLNTEIWWNSNWPYKSSLTGESASELAAAWTKTSGRQLTPSIGMYYGGIEIAADVLTRATSLDPNKILTAIGQTKLTTIFGPIEFNSHNYAETPLVGGQWVTAADHSWKVETVYDAEYPSIPLTAKMVFPLPR